MLVSHDGGVGVNAEKSYIWPTEEAQTKTVKEYPNVTY
jgi:hypothetical protein